MWNLPNAEDRHFKWFEGSLADGREQNHYIWTDLPKLPKSLSRLQFPSSQFLSLFGLITLVLSCLSSTQSHEFKGAGSEHISVLLFRISPADALSAIQKPIKLDAFDSFPAKCPFRCRRTHTSKCLKKTSSVSSFWKCHLTQDRPTWVSDFISKNLDGITLIAIIAIIWSLTQVQFTRWREENRTAPAFSTSATRGASLHHRRTELRHGQLVRFWEEFSRWLQVCTR